MSAWPHRGDCSCVSCEGAREPTGPLWRTLLLVLAALGVFAWFVVRAS